MRFFIWEFYEPRNQDLYYLPLRHIFGRIARLRALIVDQSQFAALFTWGDPIQANVEFGTVRRISIFGMWVRQAEAVPFRQSSFRAFEAVLWNLVFCSKRKKKKISYQGMHATVAHAKSTNLQLLPAEQLVLSVSVGQLQTPRNSSNQSPGEQVYSSAVPSTQA